MKIIKLQTQNVKRLSAVEITPAGHVVTIGGKNAAGKSSVLDSIEYAMAGGDSIPRVPVRKGEDKARVRLDLGELVVTRTFTAEGGTNLVVTDADGKKSASPQAILDKLVGRLAFDPLEFSRQKPVEQASTLRQLVGLDFKSLDEQRVKLFDERTQINREVKALEARIASTPKHESVPEVEQNIGTILGEQAKAAEINRKNQEVRREHEAAHQDSLRVAGLIEDLKSQIDSLQKSLSKQESALRQQKARESELRGKLTTLKDIDLAPFQDQARNAEEINRKVRQNAERSRLVKELLGKREAAENLTARMETIDSEKRKQTTQAKWPIDGLSFDLAGGVSFGGIPFDQCSESEKLRVSLAIGLALNPKLKVILIRDGSLLDQDSLQIVAGMAEKSDAQVWIEVVRSDGTVSVVIEDGHVAEAKP